MVALTFTICLAAHCTQEIAFHRTAGLSAERACRAAFLFAQSRAHPDATFRDVECKMMDGKK